MKVIQFKALPNRRLDLQPIYVYKDTMQHPSLPKENLMKQRKTLAVIQLTESQVYNRC